MSNISVGRRSDGKISLDCWSKDGGATAIGFDLEMARWLHNELGRVIGGIAPAIASSASTQHELGRVIGGVAPAIAPLAGTQHPGVKLASQLLHMRERYPATFKAHGLEEALHDLGLQMIETGGGVP